jgi:hypothetical protein
VSQPRIVGLTMVRDEDLFVERAIRNALALCDEVIALEHRSIDETPKILARLAAKDGRVRVHAIRHPRESHGFVAPYAGQDVWIAGFDGDQLYDPAGLAALRPRLLAGEFSSFWGVAGRTLNCVGLDTDRGSGRGYLGPPARGTPKLRNFAAIETWDGPHPERMHGGTIRFRAGFRAESSHREFQRMAWEEAPLRSLHLCFVPRSSRRPEAIRSNPAEMAARRTPRGRLRAAARTLRRQPRPPDGKVAAYSQGALVEVDVRPFFSG